MFARVQSTGPLGAPPRRSWRWLPEGYRRRRWLVIGIIAVVALVLGAVGLAQLRLPAGAGGRVGPLPAPDLAYYLIGLYRFSSPPVDPPYPVALEVARWIAPLSLVLAGLGAIAAVFTEQFVLVRVALWYRHHWVICGAGRVGMRLASTFRQRGVRVVLVDRGPTPADVQQCRRTGVPLLEGDATDPLVLERAKLRRASHLVVVTGDDGVNTEVARQAAGMAGTRATPLDVYVNVNDEELSLLLDQGAMFGPRRPVEYRFFNVLRLGPRALLADRPGLLAATGPRPPSMLVIGAGPIGVNLAVEAAHRWGIDNGEGDPHLRITLVAADAEAKVAAMKARWPRFGRVCDLVPLAGDPWDPYTTPFGDGVDLSGVTAVVVCPSDDAAGLRVSVLLRRRLDEAVPVVVCTTARNDSGSMLDLAGGGHGNVERYPVLDKVCEHWVDLVLSGPSVTEDLARGVHAYYVRHRREAGVTGDPSMAPWDVIPDDLRQSARRQAIDFQRKIIRLGYTIAPALEVEPAPFAFSPEEVEQLARMEHDRFVAERLGAGWSYDANRDVKGRRSPYLVCWGCLTEPVREYDREAVRDFPLVLAREGYTVRPADGSGVAADMDPGDTLDPAWTCPTCGGPAQQPEMAHQPAAPPLDRTGG